MKKSREKKRPEPYTLLPDSVRVDVHMVRLKDLCDGTTTLAVSDLVLHPIRRSERSNIPNITARQGFLVDDFHTFVVDQQVVIPRQLAPETDAFLGTDVRAGTHDLCHLGTLEFLLAAESVSELVKIEGVQEHMSRSRGGATGLAEELGLGLDLDDGEILGETREGCVGIFLAHLDESAGVEGRVGHVEALG
jgi:hypothetical protein